MYWVPLPLSLDAAPAKFSEARALRHVRRLADDIGERLVSQPGADLAWQYIHSEAAKIVALAESRSDITVKVPSTAFTPS
jgi:hypothetical protein